MKVLATLWALIFSCAAFASGPPAYWGEELANIQAVAGTPAGAVATARAGGKERTSVVRFRLPGESKDRILEIKGQVRSLAFTENDDALLAVVQKRSRRRPWDTFLLRIDTATAKTGRMVTLPRTAAGMALWPETGHLLLACDQEIRTFILPGFRSGPLYQLPGGNLTLAHHSGSLVLVGRTGDLALINLEDPQGEEQIPVRQHVGIATPLLAMTVSSDGARLYGVTLDGEKVEQPLSMLNFSAAALPLKQATPRPEPMQAPEPVENVPVVVKEPPAEPKPAPEPEPKPEPVPEPSMPAGDFQIYGSLLGAEANRVEWVVILGPNNLLREAARIQPEEDGRWGVESLPPGRYRIVLNGGGGHVIESDPRFATVQVVQDEVMEAPVFHVRRVR